MNISAHIALLKKTVSLLLAVFLAAGILCMTGAEKLSVNADELTDLQNEQAALQADKAAIQAELDLLMNEQMSALEQKVLLDQQMNLTVSEIALVEEQISVYEEMILEKEAELQERRAEEAQQLEAYCSRIRAMEESGDISYYQIIFGASDFSDLLSRIDCVSEIMECDQSLYRELIAAREATEAAEAELEAGMAELEGKRTELEALQAEQSARIAEASALISAIESDINEYRNYESQIADLEAAVQAQIDAVVAEMEQIRQDTSGPQSGGNADEDPEEDEPAEPSESPEETDDPEEPEEPDVPEDEPAFVEGGFIWPTATTLVTSAYGNRLHPIWNEWRMHTGIDIGAGYGEAIWASKSGEVITAGEDEGYGNYVVLYHDDGSTTLYAHMSEILTSVGAYVGQGETIGLVGTTGWSDGPHLHFEIRVSGSCIDPLLYLP